MYPGIMYSLRVEGGELFDRVVGVGKFSERIGKLLFYQMLVAVKVNLFIILFITGQLTSS